MFNSRTDLWQDPLSVDSDLIERALLPVPDLFERMDQLLTREHAYEVFAQISNTFAPTLSARHTAGAAFSRILGPIGVRHNMTFHQNYRMSGNTTVALGSRPRKPLWLLAHMDMICFLTSERTPDGYRLTPFCEPRARDGRYPAVALGSIASGGHLPEVARGEIVVHDDGRALFFATAAADLPSATRVMYAARAAWDQQTNIVTGYVDDAVGCAALTLATEALAAYPVEALIAYCDEEEGPVVPGPRAFSRGSDRLFNRTPLEELPDCVIVCDAFDMAADAKSSPVMRRFGEGALFAAFSSDTRGTVTPLRLLEFERALSRHLQKHRIALNEYSGRTSRSDDVSATRATANIALISMPTAYNHFADTPRMHLDDLVSLAKGLVVFTLVAQSPDWQFSVLM